MCVICGCSDNAKATITDLDSGEQEFLEGPAAGHHHHSNAHGHDHDHQHSHDHAHVHDHDHANGQGQDPAHTHARVHGTTIGLEADILAKNNRLAERNRGWFEGRNILALNLVSSPGSGKTTLLEKTILDLNGKLPISVVEGDQETLNDAARIKATGCRVVQINTGSGCHLEADMLARSLKQLQPPLDSVVMIENVGNLVCPALFDLGEHCKVAILSVTEGEDKPVKYPHMFSAANVMLLNKIDLLPYLDFDVDACITHAISVNPGIEIMLVSAKTGEGMGEWYDWLDRQLRLVASRQDSA